MTIDEIKRQLFIDSEEVCGISMIDVYNAQDSCEESYSIGYNKAIDDVMNKAKEIQEEQIKNLEQHPRRSGKQWAMYMNTHLGHIQIACKRIITEQLKAGGENE